MLEGAGTIPRSLAFDAKHGSFPVGSHSARAAQPAADRDHPAVFRNLHCPAPEQVARMIGTAQAKSHPDIALRVMLGAEGKLVPLGISPVVAQGFKAVRHTVPGGIGQAGDFTKLGDGE